jgi:hypothetical protein
MQNEYLGTLQEPLILDYNFTKTLPLTFILSLIQIELVILMIEDLLQGTVCL